MAQPKHRGITIKLEDKEYILPSLPLAAYEEENALEKMGELLQWFLSTQERLKDTKNNDSVTNIFANSSGNIKKIRELIFIAFHRNYPEITEDEFKDMLGLKELKEIGTAFINNEFGIMGAANKINEKNVGKPSATKK